MSVLISYLSYFRFDTLYKTRNCETLSQSPAPLLKNPLYTAVPDGMIKGGITQIGMAHRIAYPYSHSVSFILYSLVQVSSFILSNNHTFTHICYSSLITMSICNLHVDWKSLGPFNLWRLIQKLSWIPLLAVASVEIAPLEELYKYDKKKNWKSGCWFDPSAHHYLPNTVRLFANDFSVGDFLPEWHILRDAWRSHGVHWFEKKVS